MNFTKKKKDTQALVDTVFSIATKAKQDQDPSMVNATIGTLYGEDGKILAFDSVFTPFDNISHATKASYAQAFKGNPDYCQSLSQWILQNEQVTFQYDLIATPGGTGAVGLAFSNFLEEGDPVLIPEIGWPVYQLMAKENQLDISYYSLFEEDHFNLTALKSQIEDKFKTKDKLLLLINDPCQNPTGYSLSQEEWLDLVHFLNQLPKDKQIILLNDVAYMDYSFHSNGRSFLTHWNLLEDNILGLIAYSCSKSFTSYGLRIGGLMVCHPQNQVVQEVMHVLDKQARAIWSNISNSAMVNVTQILSHPNRYLQEKEEACRLLEKRANLFQEQADACGLEYYPFKEGFFITLKVQEKEKYHQRLMDHHIYTVQVPKGIRIALCSLSLEKIDGLAKRLKEIQGEL